jgi:allantoin racemase
VKRRRILVINPNTSHEASKSMEKACKEVVSTNTFIKVTNIETSESFSSYYVLGYVDLAKCVVETIRIAWQERKNYDGVVLAGFSDVGLNELRELLDIPVIGIAESAYHIASMLGHKFSVLTATAKWTPPKDDYIRSLGVESKVASLVSFNDWNVFSSSETLENRLVLAGKKAIKEDKAEVIIIGSGPLAGYGKRIEAKLGVPVIDPTLVAIKIMEGLIDLELKHSKILKWRKPKEKIGDVYYNRNWIEMAKSD